MEHAKKIIVNPFERIKPVAPKMKCGKDENFLRLLLHVARNDGYDESGKLKYKGTIIPDSDISTLINFTVMPLRAPAGIECFLNFLRETKVDKSLISNQELADRIYSSERAEEIFGPPLTQSITAPAIKKTYQLAPVVHGEPSIETQRTVIEKVAAEDVPRVVDPSKRRKLIKPLKRLQPKSTPTTRPAPLLNTSTQRKGQRDRKKPERYGAGWIIPQ